MISSTITSASGFTIVALRSFFHDLRIVRFYDLLNVFHAAVRNFQSESVEDLIKLAPPWKMPVYQAQEFGTNESISFFPIPNLVPLKYDVLFIM